MMLLMRNRAIEKLNECAGEFCERIVACFGALSKNWRVPNDHIIAPYFLHVVCTESFHVESILHLRRRHQAQQRNHTIQSFMAKILRLRSLFSQKKYSARKAVNPNRTDHQRIEKHVWTRKRRQRCTCVRHNPPSLPRNQIRSDTSHRL
jgi:hypothetical protein